MGHNKSFSAQEDDFEFDEAYFRQFYKPLSNLPTPPPSSRNSSVPPGSPRISEQNDDSFNTELLGPAGHLARMLPPGASFMTPSVSVVQEMLAKAELPMDIIALAVCILDSLDAKFSLSWRISFPLGSTLVTAPKRHTLPSGSIQKQHIDAVFPEVIILSALIIATKFVDDMHEPTQYYGTVWGRGHWTCEQINFTERCIMESLEYRIMPLWKDKHIKQARHDIEMARRELLDEDLGMPSESKGFRHAKSMSDGNAIVGHGMQLTPADTPRSEVSTFWS
jgi:hypothetical protein